MRFSLLLALSFSFIIQAGAMAQKISVRIETGSLDRAFQQIIGQSKIQLVYNTDVAAKIPCRGGEFEEKEVRDILEALLVGTDLVCKFENGIYIVNQKTIPAVPQQKTVKGKITDGKGSPLPGVTIRIKGTTVGMVSDNEGHYELALPADTEPVLVFSFVGMQTQEAKYNGQSELNITMHEDVSEMEEVVVTGYQTISREKVTGSTSTVTSKQLEERYTPNLLDNLEGKVAGLVTYGDKTTIRGTSSLQAETSPLLVIDGLPVEGKLEDVNPYDVESVTVLKDAAAAAIYGARASNGIIVIKTKSAKEVGRTSLDVSANFTVYQKRNLNYNDNFYLSPQQQVDAEKEYYEYYFFNNRGEVADPVGSTEDAIATGYDMISPIRYAYYQLAKGEIQRPQLENILEGFKKNNFAEEYARHALRNRFLQQYNVALRNRSAKFQSNLVLNYRRDNMGVIEAYDNRFSIFYKGTYDMSSWLSVNFSVNSVLTKEKQSNSPLAPDPFNVPAYYSLFDENGSYSYYGAYWNLYNKLPEENTALRPMGFNHLEELHKDQQKSDRRNSRFQGELLFKIIEGLTVNTQFIYETERNSLSSYSEADSYVMRWMRNIYTVDEGNNKYSYLIPENGGKLATEKTEGEYWTARGQLNFKRDFGRHTVDFLAGLEFRQTFNKGGRSLLLGYDDQLQVDATAAVDFNTLANDYNYAQYFASGYPASTIYNMYILPWIKPVKEEYHRYASGYANVTYTYNRKYNAFASFRKDYADVYGLDSKFRGKPLWSVGASWNMHNETFMSSAKWLDFLKLRTSYGITGNIFQGATSYMTGVTQGYNPFTYQPYSTIESPGNPSLKWEKTATINVGMDFTLFENRLRGTLDWYYRKGTDIFSEKNLDPSKGFFSLNMNMAALKNNGIELFLSYDWIKNTDRHDFHWNTSLTFARNKNKITRMDVQATTARDLVIRSNACRPGYPVSALFSYEYAGLDDQGLMTWRNHETGQIFSSDIYKENIDALVYSGQKDPKVSMGMDNRFSWKGFSLNVLMVYYGGHKMRVRQNTPSTALPCSALPDFYDDCWTPENTETDVPRISPNASGETGTYTDLFVQPADFIKIRNIVLGYNLPESWLAKIGLRNAVLRFQIDNPRYLWVKNKVQVDPETLSLRRPASYIFGVNINF